MQHHPLLLSCGAKEKGQQLMLRDMVLHIELLKHKYEILESNTNSNRWANNLLSSLTGNTFTTNITRRIQIPKTNVIAMSIFFGKQSEYMVEFNCLNTCTLAHYLDKTITLNIETIVHIFQSFLWFLCSMSSFYFFPCLSVSTFATFIVAFLLVYFDAFCLFLVVINTFIMSLFCVIVLFLFLLFS